MTTKTKYWDHPICQQYMPVELCLQQSKVKMLENTEMISIMQKCNRIISSLWLAPTTSGGYEFKHTPSTNILYTSMGNPQYNLYVLVSISSNKKNRKAHLFKWRKLELAILRCAKLELVQLEHTSTSNLHSVCWFSS